MVKESKPRSLILTDAEVRTLAATGQVEVWREMKVQPDDRGTLQGAVEYKPGIWGWHWWNKNAPNKRFPHGVNELSGLRCPWGTVGATVLVKEAYVIEYLPGFPRTPEHRTVHYRATLNEVLAQSWRGQWRSGATMPGFAVRFHPLLTAVRVAQNAVGAWCWVRGVDGEPGAGVSAKEKKFMIDKSRNGALQRYYAKMLQSAVNAANAPTDKKSDYWYKLWHKWNLRALKIRGSG